MLVPGAASAALVVASWLAQAELAPAEAPPPAAAPAQPAPASPGAPEEPPPRRPPNAVAVHGRFAGRPTGPDGGVPREGFSLGGTFEHRYAGLADRLGFGVGLDFFFDHFSSTGTQNSFVALQTIALERLPVRPWIAAGAGVGIASGARPVARGALGVELAFSRSNAIAVRADLTHALSGGGAFADLIDVGLGLLQRF
jgi:hypothetical protein